MYEQVKQVVLDSGLWQGKQAKTHQFVLTPAVFKITREKYAELLKLARAVCEALKGIDHMATRVMRPGYSGQGWSIVRDTLQTQVPEFDLYLRDVGSEPGPGIFKFDVIEGTDGHFWVPEIDTRVIQNWGVGILTEQMRLIAAPETSMVGSMVCGIADEFYRQGGSKADVLYLIYPDRERFYKPYFLILKTALAKIGIQVEVLHENKGMEGATKGTFFVDLPLCELNIRLGEMLAKRYREGHIRLLVPPKSHLGSKNVLGLLYNSNKEEDLEEILKAHISEETLAFLRRYIPESRLVYAGFSWEGIGQEYLLKEVISGGSKGVTLGDACEFTAKADQARRKPLSFILQKEITTLVRRLPYFRNDGELREDYFGIRLIIHANSAGNILDISATAGRNGRNIHGGKEALMFGAAIV